MESEKVTVPCNLPPGNHPSDCPNSPQNPVCFLISSNYNVAMLTQIVKIGNSQGIRIPKIILEESKIGSEVELIAEHEQIIIRSVKKNRSGWEESFKSMALNNDDKLPDEEQLLHQSSWDEEEWEWE
ncbi:MAG: AbrB/MazE/SpoVT family DNA-binding domain-containing protein [Acidobacteriota bacterium]